MKRVLLVAIVAVFLAAPGCGCDPPPDDPLPSSALGTMSATVNGTTATLTLASLSAPLRAVQVDVSVSGGQARAASGVGPWDVVEAGLSATTANPGGGPKDRFTLVVADTRRLPVNDGAFAQIVVDEGATVTLSHAVAVDANGTRRPITVVDR